jgi:hypothetical protein
MSTADRAEITETLSPTLMVQAIIILVFALAVIWFQLQGAS